MNYIIKIRNFLVEIAKMLIPVASIILVYVLNLKPLTFILDVFGIKNAFTQSITPTAEAGFVATIISLVVTIILKSNSIKNVFSIDIYDNYMEDKLIVPLAGKQLEYGNKKYKLFIKCKINYSNINIKKIIEGKEDLMVKVIFPLWISYEIENADDLGKDVIIEKSKNIFEINMSKYIGDDQFKGNLTVKIELVSSSLDTRLDGNVTANYYLLPKFELSSTIKKVILFLFYRILKFIVIFFKINIKNVDKDVSTS